ncbi:hypothetical protein [[Clostridium] polysaccharolyticum]|uniref:ABC-2 type transport system permease protein n=1 Tax=[Clostridium] polysaccharolyticum TaxID=29364 RepID=A0A1I0B9K4_9FIRM|nr:hypothetical protein [[Clostridium] polysaccharolyticum]SET02759.1 hypothetical protein SAMN04487772_1078 [[Clostridium] polysaccharolyticum]
MNLRMSLKNLYRRDSRRNIWLAVIGLLEYLFALPFCFSGKIVNFKEWSKIPFKEARGDLLISRDGELISLFYDNKMLCIVLCGLAVLNGIILFSYLSSRKKLDFYFSQPFQKRELFWVSYIQGAVNGIVPYLISLLAVLVMAGVNNCFSGTLVLVVLQTFLVNVLFYLAVYAFTILACCLTGKFVFSILGAGTLLMYFPCLLECVRNIFNGEAVSAVDLWDKYVMISPVEIYGRIYNSQKYIVYSHERLSTALCDMSDILYLIVLLVISTFAARLLYARRNSEAAGKTIAFPIAKVIIKALLVIFITLFVATSFESVFNEDTVFFKGIGLVIGAMSGLYIVDSLIELNWTACFKKGWNQFAYAAAALAVAGSVYVYSYSVRYNGLDSVPKYYSVEQAKKDGCVILDSGKLVYGEDKWKQFMEDVHSKKDSMVRVMDGGYGENAFADYVYKDGFVHEYTKYNLFSSGRRLPYLLAVDGLNSMEEEKTEYTAYVLTDKEDLTLEDYRNWEMEGSKSNFVIRELFIKEMK